MVTATLQTQLEDKVKQLEAAVSTLSDEQASRPPAQGEWSVKEILSHLAGAEAASFLSDTKRFVGENGPTLNLTPGQSNFTDSRKSANVEQLLSGVVGQYREMANWIGGLTDEQLSRTAHMPAFKETPLGENPTLQIWLGGIINFHLAGHIQDLQKMATNK